MIVRRDRVQAVLHHIHEIQNSKPGYLEDFLGLSYCLQGNAIIAPRTTTSFYALSTLLYSYEGHPTIRRYIDGASGSIVK
jgi:hypothetical protein